MPPNLFLWESGLEQWPFELVKPMLSVDSGEPKSEKCTIVPRPKGQILGLGVDGSDAGWLGPGT